MDDLILFLSCTVGVMDILSSKGIESLVVFSLKPANFHRAIAKPRHVDFIGDGANYILPTFNHPTGLKINLAMGKAHCDRNKRQIPSALREKYCIKFQHNAIEIRKS